MLTHQSFLVSKVSSNVLHNPPFSLSTPSVQSLERKSPFEVTRLKEEERNRKLKENGKRRLEIEGRWTKSEHQKFLEALKLYGRNWKLIQAFVGTRSATQARSHAQKYFAKLRKNNTMNRQEITSAASSPIFKPEMPSKSSIIIPPNESSQNSGCSKDKPSETLKTFSIERQGEEQVTVMPLFPLEGQKKWLAEHSLHEPDYMSPPAYEPILLLKDNDPCSTTSQEPDLYFFSPSTLHVEYNNEESEYPSLSLSKKYPALGSIFE